MPSGASCCNADGAEWGQCSAPASQRSPFRVELGGERRAPRSKSWTRLQRVERMQDAGGRMASRHPAASNSRLLFSPNFASSISSHCLFLKFSALWAQCLHDSAYPCLPSPVTPLIFHLFDFVLETGDVDVGFRLASLISRLRFASSPCFEVCISSHCVLIDDIVPLQRGKVLQLLLAGSCTP
jgi:hypothetical protein